MNYQHGQKAQARPQKFGCGSAALGESVAYHITHNE